MVSLRSLTSELCSKKLPEIDCENVVNLIFSIMILKNTVENILDQGNKPGLNPSATTITSILLSCSGGVTGKTTEKDKGTSYYWSLLVVITSSLSNRCKVSIIFSINRQMLRGVIIVMF